MIQLVHKNCGGPVEQTAAGIWHEQRCRRCGAKKEWRDEVRTTEIELDGGSERLARGYDLAHGRTRFTDPAAETAGTASMHPLPGTEEHGVPVRLPPGTDGQVLHASTQERGNDHD